MVVLADIGVLSLWLLYLWLVSAAGASWLSQRKGWGPSVGLAFGLLLSAVGLLVWLLVPSRRRWQAFRRNVRREAERAR
jgi:hypothetical protein